MKHYAITLPQLIAQAVEHGIADNEIVRLRAGYDLAERMADGLYRSQGCPFINHLVRTSSIVLVHGGSINQVLAAMLHSAYMLDCFHYSRRRAFKPKDRDQLSAAVGAEVEEIIWEYHRLPWGKREALATHLDNLPTYSPLIRSVLFARIANELEDFLDLAVQYRAKYNYRNRITAIGGLCIEIASRLDVPDLGQALEEAYEETLSRQIPTIVVREHINAYELPRRHYNEKNLFEYAKTKAGKLLRKLFHRRGRGQIR
jgi:hypothetical protein